MQTSDTVLTADLAIARDIDNLSKTSDAEVAMSQLNDAMRTDIEDCTEDRTQELSQPCSTFQQAEQSALVSAELDQTLSETFDDLAINGPATKPKNAHLSIERRRFLRGLGATATAAAAANALPAAQAEVKAAAMRSSERSTTDSAAQKIMAERSSNSITSSITGSIPGQPLVPPVAVVALNRMGWGPRAGDVAAFTALGATPAEQLAAYVEEQTNPDSIDDSECDAKLAEQGFTTLDSSIQELWTTYVKPTVDDPDYERYQPLHEVRTATFIRGLYSKRQLFEVMTDFWHNHFNVYGWDYWIAPAFSYYDREVIRANVFGNFRAMLEDVARSPAMLYYLDNQSNEGGDPNENYARELFELHGMGAENYLGVRDPNDPDLLDEDGNRIGYIDADVYGSTTCFTGWRVNDDTGVFEFDDSRHFPFQKVVMGQIFPSFQGIKDGQDVLDLIASHPGTARYICRKLCRRLVSDEPTETLVQSAADVFMAQQDAPDQIRQVVQHILLSDEFETSWGSKIKRPFELTMSLLRSANADFEPSGDFYWWYDQLGQSLFRWGPPNGYPDSREAWSTTMPMVQRWRFVNRMLLWNYGDESERRRLSFASQTPSSVNTPRAIVDYWANRILARALPPEEHLPILEYVAQGRNPDFELPAEDLQERLPYAIGLIFMSPSFQWK